MSSDAEGELETVDVLRYGTDGQPVYRAVPSGDGPRIVEAHEEEVRRRRRFRAVFVAGIVAIVVGYGVADGTASMGVLAGGIVAVLAWLHVRRLPDPVPEVVERRMSADRANRQYDIEDGRERAGRP